MNRIKDILCVLLVIAALLAVRTPAAAQVRPVGEGIFLGKVQGLAENVKDAESEAAEMACARIQEYLLRNYPGRNWKPERTDVWTSRILHSREAVEKNLTRSGKMVEVSYEVIVTPGQLAEMESIERQQRVQDRHRWLALILAGIAAGLVVLKVYLWLEELTRGYSTNLLRAAALVILGLVIAVLIWLA
jgi:hypothetical protein